MTVRQAIEYTMKLCRPENHALHRAGNTFWKDTARVVSTFKFAASILPPANPSSHLPPGLTANCSQILPHQRLEIQTTDELAGYLYVVLESNGQGVYNAAKSMGYHYLFEENEEP